ncbi:intestinal mucin-like protein [Xenopus laevis]|uniref:Intestinal mucin-like protein n=1 Tax=Xenopus laevis TaxID=8355 RepID=A0A8J1MX23_XENLA|nr:intestinal mucin-like protein [Xenopus laevis]
MYTSTALLIIRAQVHQYGDRFVLECQDCECREGHFEITCSPHECPLVETTCDEEGFYPVTYISSEDMCCNKTECRCNPSLCSNSPLNCDPGFQLNATFPEGHCCPIYTCVPKNVCVYYNAEYLPDTQFYENCTVCECLSSSLEVRCNPVKCAAQCDTGFEPQYNSSSCCPECIQTQCVLNINGSTLLIKPGESITRDCTTFSCPSSGVGFEIGVSDIICPPFDEDECRPENIQLSNDGCCKTCNKKNGCKLKTYLQNVTSENCQAQVLMTRCEGLCETYSMYSSAANEISHTCNCCRDTETSIKSTTLLCQDGNQISYMYTGIDQCGCMGTVCGLPKTQP